MKTPSTFSAAEASAELNVSRQTLYAYVSRGRIRSIADENGKRTRRYDATDVRRLKERQETRYDPARAAAEALDWGVPVRESALTLIEGGQFYYRGKCATDLAGDWSVEQVAAWLWLADERQADAILPATTPPQASADIAELLQNVPPIERLQAALPLLGGRDLEGYDLRRPHVARTGARILRQMVRIAVHPSTFGSEEIAESLTSAWLPSRPELSSLISAALILCADHELNVSSFTGRCVASAGSSPYLVVAAGLAALQGFKHGGNTERVESLLHEIGSPHRAREVIARRVRRGEGIPGFGHPLYPDGDPRARLLLDRLTRACPDAPGLNLAQAVASEAREMIHEEPNIDFALCALAAAAGLPTYAPLTIFALGRTIGWIGHAIEEYEADSLIRPRARYTGPLPSPVGRDAISSANQTPPQ